MNVLVINGHNLNMLGYRPKEHYGSLKLDDINKLMEEEKGNLNLEFFQSNSEGDIVTKIQDVVFGKYDAIIINPGAYTHTSVAIHDALEMFYGPKIEVHLSAVDSREDFRKINFVRDVCTKTFQGQKEGSYLEAVRYLKNINK